MWALFNFEPYFYVVLSRRIINIMLIKRPQRAVTSADLLTVPRWKDSSAISSPEDESTTRNTNNTWESGEWRVRACVCVGVGVCVCEWTARGASYQEGDFPTLGEPLISVISTNTLTRLLMSPIPCSTRRRTCHHCSRRPWTSFTASLQASTGDH